MIPDRSNAVFSNALTAIALTEQSARLAVAVERPWLRGQPRPVVCDATSPRALHRIGF